jgi:hypothetical protein
MYVHNGDAVTGTGTRWPADAFGVVTATAANSPVASAACSAIESITILVADASASTILIRNHADSATIVTVTVPTAASKVAPYEIGFGRDGLAINGGFSIDPSVNTLVFTVSYRRVG